MPPRFFNLFETKTSFDGDDADNVVFLIFLEPHQKANVGLGERFVDFAIKTFQPKPTLIHTELVILTPTPQPHQTMNFATYLGSSGNWQRDSISNELYYLGETANKWRAVPVFGPTQQVRDACDECVGCRYSLLRYITSTRYLRKLSWFLPDACKSPAHCATLTSRVVKRGISDSLQHCSAWYAPTSLYLEVTGKLKTQKSNFADFSNDDFNIHTMLRCSDESVRQVPIQDINSAIRKLTQNVVRVAQNGDIEDQIKAQKQLATAVLRLSCMQ